MHWNPFSHTQSHTLTLLTILYSCQVWQYHNLHSDSPSGQSEVSNIYISEPDSCKAELCIKSHVLCIIEKIIWEYISALRSMWETQTHNIIKTWMMCYIFWKMVQWILFALTCSIMHQEMKGEGFANNNRQNWVCNAAPPKLSLLIRQLSIIRLHWTESSTIV